MKRTIQIENQIENIKSQLQEIGIIRPGSLTKQFKNPKLKKGPYHQISYTHQMKSKTEYVRKEFELEVRNQINEYKRFKKLIEKWIALGIEHSQISMKQKKKDSES